MDLIDNIKAIIVLNAIGGTRIAKYYDNRQDKRQFELKLYERTKKQKREDVFEIEDSLVMHRYRSPIMGGLHYYVVGSKGTNPLVIERLTNCLVEVMSSLGGVSAPDDGTSFAHILFTLEEICEGGTVLEIEPDCILDRVCLREQKTPTGFHFPWLN